MKYLRKTKIKQKKQKTLIRHKKNNIENNVLGTIGVTRPDPTQPTQSNPTRPDPKVAMTIGARWRETRLTA